MSDPASAEYSPAHLGILLKRRIVEGCRMLPKALIASANDESCLEHENNLLGIRERKAD